LTDPRVIRAKAELRRALAEQRAAGATVGLVPTMGSLHEGHLSLIRAARERCDTVVMSLFVNPAQFGAGEDFDAYPRDEERDVRLTGEAGADLVYAPAAGDVYPEGFATYVAPEGQLAEVLEGEPTGRGAEHFRGVATVVAKLLNTVTPDTVFFGQKDAQQALLIKRMVADLDFPVEVVVVPTVREADGVAMSSRNRYLSQDERIRAAALWRALEAVQAAARDDVPPDEALGAGRRTLAEAGIEPEYLEARYADDLRPATTFNGRPVLVAVAARVGRARLIDNVVIGAGAPGTR